MADKKALKEARQLEAEARQLKKDMEKLLEESDAVIREGKESSNLLNRMEQRVQLTVSYLGEAYREGKQLEREINDTLGRNPWYRRALDYVLRRGNYNGFFVLGVISIILSLIFFSPNLTGNAVLSFNKISYNFLGIILFVIGLVGLLFHSRKWF